MGQTGIKGNRDKYSKVLAVVSRAAPGDGSGAGGTGEEAKQLPEALGQGGTELNLPFAAHAGSSGNPGAHVPLGENKHE